MNTLELARQYGIEDGIEKERKKAEDEKRLMALKLREMGLATADIFKVVGLNIQENERL